MKLRIATFSIVVLAAASFGIADHANAQLLRQQVGNAANQIINQGIQGYNKNGGSTGNFGQNVQKLGRNIGHAAQQYGRTTGAAAGGVLGGATGSPSIGGTSIGQQAAKIGRYGQKFSNQIASGQSAG